MLSHGAPLTTTIGLAVVGIVVAAAGVLLGWWPAPALGVIFGPVQTAAYCVAAAGVLAGRALMRSRRRWQGLTAFVVASGLVASAATGAFGTFSASTNAVHTASTGNPGDAPTSPLCQWDGLADLQLDWTAAGSGDGTDVLRSTTQGSGHASIATATPLANDTYHDTTVNPNTALPAEYFYVLQTMFDAWRSPSSSELRTSTCPGYTTTYAGSAGTHASSPTGVAMQPNRIAISGTTMYVTDEMNVVRAINMSTGAVTIVARDGGGFSGDGGRGDLANVNRPYGIAVDSQGNRYIGDYVNRRIRKVTSGGTISTIAGDGTSSNGSCLTAGDACGDGGLATAAVVSSPLGIVVDSADNILFVDNDRCRVRRIDASTGIITTVVGITGASNCGNSGDGGDAASAKLNAPQDVAFASDGDLFIADTGNKVIRKVEAGGDGIIDPTDDISTVVGTGAVGAYAGTGSAATSAELAGPSSVLLSGSTLYVPDPTENVIRSVDTGTGTAGHFAGTRVAGTTGDYGHIINARLNGPRYMASDAAGNIYIADTANHCIRVIYMTDVLTNSMGTYAGTCGSSGTTNNVIATLGKLNSPRGMVFDDEGSLFIADSGNHVIRKVTKTGFLSTFAGTMGSSGNAGDGGNSLIATLNTPSDVAWDTTVGGRLLIADTANNRIRRVATAAGNGPGAITNIAGSSAGTACGTPTAACGDGGSATSATLSAPRGIHWVDNNNIYIADTGDHRIRKFTTGSTISAFAGDGTVCSAPTAACGDGSTATAADLNAPEDVHGTSTVYIADTGDKRVRSVASGNIAASFGDGNSPAWAGDGGAATSAQLDYPVGIAVVGAGSVLYIADNDQFRVRKVTAGADTIVDGDSDDVISTFAGDGRVTEVTNGDGGAATSAQLQGPTDVAVSGSDVYIADGDGFRVRKVTGGNISTYAGTGGKQYAGDGGAATSAQLNGVAGLAVNPAGTEVMLSDEASHKVRVISTGTGVLGEQWNRTGAAGAAPTAGVVGDGDGATSATFGTITDVVRDPNGIVYVVERATNRVRKIDPTGEVTTFAGTGAAGFTGDGGAATSAQLNAPDGLALDSSNNLYIADTGSHCVRKVVVATGVITTHVGLCGTSGNADGALTTTARLDNPTGIMFDENGDFYIADTGNDRIRVVTSGAPTVTANYAGNASGIGCITPTLACGDGGAATSATLNAPRRLARDPGGNLTFIADTGDHRIRRVNSAGNIAAYACSGAQGNTDHTVPTTGTCNGPRGLAWDDEASDLYFADTGNNRIRVVAEGNLLNFAGDTSTNPGLSGTAGDAAAPSASSRFNAPEGLFLRYWIGDSVTNGWPELFVADTGNNKVRRIDFRNSWLTVFAGTGTTGTYAYDGLQNGALEDGLITSPAGIAFSPTALMAVADSGARRIRQGYSPGASDFRIRTIAGDGVTCSAVPPGCGDTGKAVNAQFANPTDVTFDASGNMYVVDYGAHRVRRVYAGADGEVDGESDETITTIAGTGTAGSAGDGSAASSATLDNPIAAFVYDYDLYIVEYSGNRVRKVEAGGNNVIEATDTISLVVGTGTAGSTGDGGAATSATLNGPSDIVFDGSGNMYIAAFKGCRVRKVISGTISTLYGGNCGSTGDHGGAYGSYGWPSVLALDATGNLYVGEGLDGGVSYPPGHRIRKIYEADAWVP